MHNKPRPCWLVWNSDHMPPTPGILLEWRKVEDGRMAAGFRWEGLVVYAAGGGDLPWHMNLSWERESRIRPMEVPEPPPSKDPWNAESRRPSLRERETATARDGALLLRVEHGASEQQRPDEKASGIGERPESYAAPKQRATHGASPRSAAC